MAGSPESIQTKYEQIRRFLSVGEIPSTYNKSKRFNFKQYCAKFTLKDGEIYCDQRQVVKSEEEALTHFGEVHTLPIGGHAGFNKTCSALSSKWFWHGMTQDIRKWIQECDKCQKVGRLQTAPQQLQCIKAKKTPRKAKCKSKKCILCRKKLDPNYLSSHCEACVKRIVEDVSPSFSKSIQEVVREEIKACMSTWSSVQPEPSYSTIAIHSSVPGFTEERDFFELEEGDLDEESEILVEARPVIWDKSLEVNKDCVAKEEAWTEVFHNLFQDWDSKTAREQGAIEMQVTKRWCSVRDAFHKHQQKQARSGSGGDTGSTYKYYNLLPSQELSGTSSNVDFQSEDEVVEGANSTPEEPNITTTDDPQASGDDEEVDIPISQAASEQPIETSQDVERVEDSDVPGSSGVQPSRLTPPDPRRITLPSRRATARAALRRRLRPEHDFIEEIIALIHRQRSEDGSGAFGRAIAERLRTLPVQQLTPCMSFMLGCSDYFEEPYVAPPIPILLSYMMERCSSPTTRSAQRSQIDSSTQTEWQQGLYGNRPLGHSYVPQEQYHANVPEGTYSFCSPYHVPPNTIPYMPPQQHESDRYSDFSASLRHQSQ